MPHVLIFQFTFFLGLNLSPLNHVYAISSECHIFLKAYSSEDLKYFREREIEVREISVDWPEKNEVLSELFGNIEQKPKKIAQAIADLGAAENLIMQTLVYPSSGYDGTTGFLIAPDVTTVVGIDNHPFMKSSIAILKPEPYFSVNDRGRGWTVISEVDFKNYLAEIILARLQSAIAGFRLIQVLQVIDHTKDDHEESPLLHGVIVFDSGEGTPVKRYVHLQSPVLNTFDMRPTSWWRETVLGLGFKVLIRKAAMSFFNFPIGVELIRHLKSNQGLLIDGDNDKGSFTRFNFQQEIADTPRIHLPISNFGYGSYTVLYYF